MINLKPLKEKMVFTYLYDRLFTGYRKDDLKRIDVINYSFGVVEDGKVSLSRLKNIEEVIGGAHAEGVRVVLSIGGWGAGGFSEAVSTPESRTTFVKSIVEAVEKHHFDGVDMDWEYPTTSVAGISSAPEDRENFTLFMEELRKALNDLDENLLLTIAVPASNFNTYYEIAKLNPLLDYLHIMTYDMSSMQKATHHTNLYPSQYSLASVDEAVNGYIESGITKEKVIVGIAYYGHIFTGANGIGSECTKRTHITYVKIMDEYVNNPEYQKGYDEDAKASFVYGKDTFISYEDAESIKNKCRYVKEHGLGGVMVWEYCQDDADSTLTKAIVEGLK
ncbi:MAG TPA: hypothetical protein GXZ48_00840 [Acholeplasmataceae bacterium]|jgi:chitinase|nr:hypothetical protein [Acholeplasmataceae bacterium]